MTETNDKKIKLKIDYCVCVLVSIPLRVRPDRNSFLGQDHFRPMTIIDESPTQRIARQFQELDSDGDGAIALDEIRQLLNENRAKTDLRDEQVSTLLDVAERKKGSFLDFRSFSLLVTSAKAQRNKRKKALYSVADIVIARSERPYIHTYIDEYNCVPPPFFIIFMSLAQILTFAWYLHGSNHSAMNYCAGCWVHGGVGPFLFAPPLRFQIWRFFTYQLIHQGLVHLVPNVIMQIVIGIPLELVHKSWRIAPIYLLAVCMGALLQYTLDPSVYLIGCSAGVYALIAAHLSNVLINWAEMPYRYLRLTVLTVYVVFDITASIYRRLQSDKCDQISYTAHIGGAVTGLLMGVYFLHNLEVLNWERILKIISLLTYAAILVFMIAMVIFVEPFSKPIWDVSKC